ncbi:sensor histidine kinase [Dictyobacter alpinus]|nr:sensor histidine kinase [Dictyobacter alpinus]
MSQMSSSSWVLWLRLGLSEFTALSFLAVGSLVWYYANNRLVAVLLFGFCFSLMGVFTVEMGAALDIFLFSLITSLLSILAASFLASMLLVFPDREKNAAFALRYLRIVVGISIVGGLAIVYYYLAGLPAIFRIVYAGSMFCLLSLCIFRIVIMYMQAPSDQRQRYLILFGGTILPIALTLIVTIVPVLFGLKGVPGEVSSVGFVLIPLSLAYVILRYQILIMDSYLFQQISRLTWMFTLVSLMYLILVLTQIWPELISFSSFAPLTFLYCLCGIAMRPVANILTERIFYPRQQYVSKHLGSDSSWGELFEVEEVSQVIMHELARKLETLQIVLFILDEKQGRYVVSPAQLSDHQRYLLDILHRQVVDIEQAIPIEHKIIRAFQQKQTPQFLSQMLSQEQNPPLSHYLSSPHDPQEILLAPFVVYQKMLGLLVLGSRDQPYAGTDFEMIMGLLQTYAAQLHIALHMKKSNQLNSLLNQLYSVTSSLALSSTDQASASMNMAVDEILDLYASIAAQAIAGRAEIWLMDQDHQYLSRQAQAGIGLGIPVDRLPMSDVDWMPLYTSPSLKEAQPVLSALPETISPHSFVRLPLTRRQKSQRFGILFLFYTFPYIISPQEERIFAVYANQCAAAVELAEHMQEIQSMYARQHMLGELKDRFLAMAGYELIAPLQQMQRYIDLLADPALSMEQRSSLLANSLAASDLFLWKIEQLLDAARDRSALVMQPILLAPCVEQIVKRYLQAYPEAVPPHIEITANATILVDELRFSHILSRLLIDMFSPQWSITLSSYPKEAEQKLELVLHFHPGEYSSHFPLFEKLLDEMECTFQVQISHGIAIMQIPLAGAYTKKRHIS